jgi:hypothetical protein
VTNSNAAGDELPERGRDVADERERRAPINLAPAAKVASHDSIAFANAEQTVDTEQLN